MVRDLQHPCDAVSRAALACVGTGPETGRPVRDSFTKCINDGLFLPSYQLRTARKGEHRESVHRQVGIIRLIYAFMTCL